MIVRKKEYTTQVIQENLHGIFGFDSFKGDQLSIIQNLLAGNDTFVIMPTGGGKSLCYQLPAMLMEGVAIVISPLIALMKNQVDAIRTFSMEDGVANFLNSSLNRSAVQKVKDDVLSGKTKLLYFAPESLTKEENIELLRKVNISFYAIDEAHCISEWGHDFRPEYRRIRPIISEIGHAPVIALTATATPKVQIDILKNLGMSNAKIFKSSFNRPNLYYEIRPKIDVNRELIKYIKLRGKKSGIIYCLSRKKVEELAEFLNVNGIVALPYHAGLDATTRAENQDAFIHERCQVIVATIAFGMGIDKPDVRFVIHYDIPKSLEGYYQETGRAGRDGGTGECITFYSYKDIQKLEKFMQGKPVAEQEIGKLLLSETVSYAESTTCRRKTLLHYFGEEYTEENCGNCDNCLHPAKKEEAKEETLTILELISEIGAHFKTDHIVDIVVGKNSTILKSYHHDKLEYFGIGKSKGENFWNSVIRNAVQSGLLIKDIENYGVLSISRKGEDFKEHPTSIMVSIDRSYEEEGEDSQPQIGGGGGADPTLFAILKSVRSDLAKSLNLPPYVIFQDPTLEEMAIQYPTSIEEVQSITGVGTAKAEKYGKSFIEIIEKYIEENEITPPQKLVIRQVAKTEHSNVFIIQCIDRKMDFEDIAHRKSMTLEDVISEIERIVSNGTKLNIDYYLNDNIDEDKIEDILAYFKENAEDDSIDSAVEELGDSYTTEEIRLVRIKYLSEKSIRRK